MTFTFGEDLTDAGDYVRFHTGDTDSPGFMSDELITSLIAVEGTNNKAVIAGLKVARLCAIILSACRFRSFCERL